MGKIYNRYGDNWKRKKLRNQPTKGEIILWEALKRKQIHGTKFRRQYGVGPFVVDFYCAKLRLVIEVDGESHYAKGAKEYDKRRQQYIENYGIRFLRFENNEVFENLDGIIERIIEEIDKIKSNRSGGKSERRSGG